ncbi:MAG TPA: hypothetical protein VHT04_04075 [Stellaceae bacterium]|jgi:hypothetical protein|nr:hypothetical protein [Stellaceae bacterium]
MRLKLSWFGRRRDVSPSVVKATAQDLVGRFGERSTCIANHQALKAGRRHDGLAVVAWRWVARSTVEILRCEPDEISPG